MMYCGQMRAFMLVKSAREYDLGGNASEALRHYEDGIQELIKLHKNESEEVEKNSCLQIIIKCLKRKEHIKQIINDSQKIGKVVDVIQIVEKATGYTYNGLFGKYLDDSVTNVLLEEPHLLKSFQYANLTMFMELLVAKCHNLKHIMVTTKRDPNGKSSQSSTFSTLVEVLKKHNIELQFKFDDIHDREIRLSNGYVIIIGRGLHIYHRPNEHYAPGLQDYNFRECRSTKVHILKNVY